MTVRISRLNILSDVPRLELRLFWEIHSAGVDSAVQSRLGLRLWEITSAVVDDADGCAGGDDSFRKKMILDRRFGQATRI